VKRAVPVAVNPLVAVAAAVVVVPAAVVAMARRLTVRKLSLKAMPMPLLSLLPPTTLSLPMLRPAHLASSVDLRRMVFPARLRSWSPTFPTTSARRRYA
jgi:hypothetical protein